MLDMHFGFFMKDTRAMAIYFCFGFFSVKQESMLGCLYLLLSSPVLESRENLSF